MKHTHLFFILFTFAFVLTGCKDPKPEPEPEVDVLDKITDPVFLAYCQNAMNNEQELFFESDGYWTHTAWDSNGNGKLSPEEAANVLCIDIHGYYVNSDGYVVVKEESEMVASLAGIEYFTGLILFNCSYNLLTELNISGCSELYGLYCYMNQLTLLDISGNADLVILDCSSNRLTELDMSKNTALAYLSCFFNQLSSLDISKNSALLHLYCQGNALALLNVSENPNLKTLHCHDNKLVSLDISKNTSLDKLLFFSNPGDGTRFFISAWFDNDSCPKKFQTEPWVYHGGGTIYVIYQKVS